jgi:hypothetical protein
MALKSDRGLGYVNIVTLIGDPGGVVTSSKGGLK